MLTFPAGHPNRKTGDQMLYKIIERKNKLKTVVDQILERASTGSNQRPQRISFSPTKKSRRNKPSRKINKRDIKKLTMKELKTLANLKSPKTADFKTVLLLLMLHSKVKIQDAYYYQHY